MSDTLPPRHTLDSLKKDAKHWLAALRSHTDEASDRYRRAMGVVPPAALTLRDVQLALAREHGFAGWSDLKQALAPRMDTSSQSLAHYEMAAEALLEAYRTGTPEAMERHYALTWHRRAWPGMRTYVQLDLGRRPQSPGADVPITLDDARYLVAREHGFDDWDRLRQFVVTMPGGLPLAAKPMRVLRATQVDESLTDSRDWHTVLRALGQHSAAGLDAHGQMTDVLLEQLSHSDSLVDLRLGGSQAVSDAGVAHLARMPALRHLDLSGTGITDRGLEVLRSLPALQMLSLAMTRVTDAGMVHLTGNQALESVNLMWTATGDGALRALAGKAALRQVRSGNGVTDAGLPLLHDFPVFKRWHGGDTSMALLSYSAEPNQLLLRGPFTDRGLESLRGLDGLFGLNLDAAELGITAAGLVPLTTLPNLGWLAVDARDDWMPVIARMPTLRFLGCQDTSAGDDGFVALSRSRSLEMIWGRRSHNLRRRGFEALATMPSLRGLSTSLLNVEDAGLAALPDFPALRELMPIDVPDAGYRHIGRCAALESLILMYCRDTTDAATEQITGLDHLTYYFNSYTIITDRTPELLSGMPSLERLTFDACHNLTDEGIRQLARLPRLKELRVAGRGLTSGVKQGFPDRVMVHYDR